MDRSFKIVAVTNSFLYLRSIRREDIVGCSVLDVLSSPSEPILEGALQLALEKVIASRQPLLMSVQRERMPVGIDTILARPRYWSPSLAPILSPDGAVELILYSLEDVTEIVTLKVSMGKREEAAKEFQGRSDEMVAELSRRDDEAVLLAQQSLLDLATSQERDLRMMGQSNEMKAELNRRDIQAVVQAKQKVLDRVENKAKERRLHIEAEHKFKSLLEMAPDAMVIINQSGTILSNNSQAEILFGYQENELLGEPADVLLWVGSGPYQIENVAKFFGLPMNRTPGEVIELMGLRKDLQEFPFEVTFSPLSTVDDTLTILAIRDLTERRKLNTQVIRNQRLESIGTFAGNIAHDLNNALAPVLMSLELLRTLNPESAELVNSIESGANRGADMLRQLLVFSKGSYVEPRLFSPALVIEDLEGLIHNTFPSNIKFHCRIEEGLRQICGDATQIHQVLVNLCINARDAMLEGGELSVSAENVEIDDRYAGTIPGALPGTYVLLRISDTGSGIPADILDRIFEPFFTTKRHEKGTGLGLSIVVGIVKSHHGFLNAYSTPLRGSTFSVYIPADLSHPPEPGVEAPVQPTFRGNGQTILVVDDSQVMREVTQRVLEALSLQVVTATDGEDALRLIAGLGKELCAIITDVHMPNMNGLSFVRELRRTLPNVGIVVISGNLDETEANAFMEMGVHTFLEKPFTQDKLTGALSEVLRSSANSACSLD